LVALGESNSVVLLIEVSVVLSHEDVSEDHVVEGRGEGGSHDSQHALSDAHVGDLEHVVVVGQGVISSINSESDIGKVLDSFAGSLDSDSVNEFVDQFLGSDQD